MTLINLVPVLWTIFRQTVAFWGGWQFCTRWHVRGTSDTVRKSCLSDKQGRPLNTVSQKTILKEVIGGCSTRKRDAKGGVFLYTDH